MLNSYTSTYSRSSSISVQRNPITIEFVGLPGAGKTTSCKYFSNLLKTRGVRTCEINDIKEFIRGSQLTRKSFLVLKLVFFRSPRVISYILSLLSKNIFTVDSIYRYIRLTLFDLALQQLKKNRKIDVVLLDQWIIQEMWSATIFKTKAFSAMSKTLARFYFSTDAVLYFDVDVNTASERIETRPTNLSRFDRMDETKRIAELRKHSSYLFELYQNSGCKQKHMVSGYNSSEENAALIFKLLDSNFQLN